MAKPIRYTATFADGSTITRASHRTYTHAWRATFVRWDKSVGTKTGFAASLVLAGQAARREGGPNAATEFAPVVVA